MCGGFAIRYDVGIAHPRCNLAPGGTCRVLIHMWTIVIVYKSFREESVYVKGR